MCSLSTPLFAELDFPSRVVPAGPHKAGFACSTSRTPRPGRCSRGIRARSRRRGVRARTEQRILMGTERGKVESAATGATVFASGRRVHAAPPRPPRSLRLAHRILTHASLRPRTRPSGPQLARHPARRSPAASKRPAITFPLGSLLMELKILRVLRSGACAQQPFPRPRGGVGSARQRESVRASEARACDRRTTEGKKSGAPTPLRHRFGAACGFRRAGDRRGGRRRAGKRGSIARGVVKQAVGGRAMRHGRRALCDRSFSPFLRRRRGHRVRGGRTRRRPLCREAPPRGHRVPARSRAPAAAAPRECTSAVRPASRCPRHRGSISRSQRVPAPARPAERAPRAAPTRRRGPVGVSMRVCGGEQ